MFGSLLIYNYIMYLSDMFRRKTIKILYPWILKKLSANFKAILDKMHSSK